MIKETLLILTTGRGSRYGGPGQIDPAGRAIFVAADAIRGQFETTNGDHPERLSL